MAPVDVFQYGWGRAGYLAEYEETNEMFTNPKNRLTENYITGRFG